VLLSNFTLLERSFAKLARMGVLGYDGSRLPRLTLPAKLIAPMGREGPIFMVYENFRIIMKWNNSTNYALSIGLLSDSYLSEKPLVLKR
jgi:membrane-bound lytic murein transglycosylase B